MFYLSWSVNNYKKGNKNEKILMIILAIMISLTSLPLYVFANDVSETAESQIAEQNEAIITDSADEPVAYAAASSSGGQWVQESKFIMRKLYIFMFILKGELNYEKNCRNYIYNICFALHSDDSICRKQCYNRYADTR